MQINKYLLIGNACDGKKVKTMLRYKYIYIKLPYSLMNLKVTFSLTYENGKFHGHFVHNESEFHIQ